MMFFMAPVSVRLQHRGFALFYYLESAHDREKLCHLNNDILQTHVRNYTGCCIYR